MKPRIKRPTWEVALVLVVLSAAGVCRVSAGQSIARVWDEEILSAIRIDLPNPPVHARNLFHLSVAMYDAWAAYDPTAVGYLFRGKVTASDVAAARQEAISYAAYRLLTERYTLSHSASNTLAALDARLASLGYDKNNQTLDPTVPAGLGNRVAAMVSAFFLNDGAQQARGYQDLPVSQGGYAPVNPPLITGASGTLAVDPNRWQPLIITNAISQNDIPVDAVQKFVGATWLAVRPFALARTGSTLPWYDPGPPPHLDGVGDARYRAENVDLILRSSELTPDDGATMDISPGAWGNNTLGANDGSGRPLNPVTGQPYAPNVVKRGDFGRVVAEFWADGPNSETPPGHWNVIANDVSDNPNTVKRLGGTGPVLDDLEWDVKLYLALNSAVHDAACAAWSLKRYYDGWRPIEAIRFMGQLGQNTNTNGPSYHMNGLPLIPGLIELVTPETGRPGGRHAGLAVNSIAIYAWPGPPASPTLQHSGARWINAADWLPYQKKTFVTPSFPGYISGHSTFSRAGAEVLAGFTGTPFFPGGMGVYTVTNLAFEAGPTQPVHLQWATYFDASDQAGISRLWGGIHVSTDDLTGRRIGALCGQGALVLAKQYYDGSILRTPVAMQIQDSASGCTLSWPTCRGMFYQVQTSSDLLQGFANDPSGFVQALDSTMTRAITLGGPHQFFRVIAAGSPPGTSP